MTSVYDFTVRSIKGESISLEQYRGKVLLIVNTASQCGFTPQYAGLENLYQRYQEQGFEVLAFPCNQFGGQEPGDADVIQQFCSTRYQIHFPLFAKVEVNGEQTEPLFAFLKSQAKGILGTEAIKWNFTKFLVDQQGRVLERYASASTPESIGKDIEKLLQR